MQSTHIVNEGTYGVLDEFGPTLEFLILPERSGRCLLRDVPPNTTIGSAAQQKMPQSGLPCLEEAPGFIMPGL
jgi:hypothetical protein